MSVPSVKLSNGYNIPIIGLGTWQSPPGEVDRAVRDAIDAGYRQLDCAFGYGNENEVGNAIQAKIAEGTVKREDLFITSKLWNTYHEPQHVRMCVEMSLKNLKLDYLDLYLIHWPHSFKYSGAENFPKNEDGSIIYDYTDYLDTWGALEALVDEGLIRSIGVSNFNSEQLDRVYTNSRIKPVMNQVECHPYLNQSRLIEFARARNIAITAYSPLGSPNRPWAQPGDPQLMEDPKIVAIANKYNKSPAQILIRYQVQRGVVVIPKSTTKSRIESNFDVFGFELTEEDVTTIDGFDCNGRLVPLLRDASHPYYPFSIPF
ncbi:Aldo-keto reductase family 1 member A1-A [Pseudolycoriella hygida]|uniref:Aldo-keto reductase family 1 member A1-A n=1 Tax=Pseudolycoriella hygida TaxID=35572 RepID=A0A9Q0N6Y5_9DIPT|nr:Aldo-keto reductase family 1 member A1-A [Pseudolycoriella hygida]